MFFTGRVALGLCLFLLFFVVSAHAQLNLLNLQKSPTLQNAKTADDVFAYLENEIPKLKLNTLDSKQQAEAYASLLMPASEKLWEVAKTAEEKQRAYTMRYNAFAQQMQAEVTGAEQKMEAFLKELAAKEETKEMEETFRFQNLVREMRLKGIKETEHKMEAFIAELAVKERTEQRTQLLRSAVNRIVSLKYDAALQSKVPAEQAIKEISEYIQSPQCRLPVEVKREMTAVLEAKVRLLVGSDPKLYGKTLDNKDFKWESLRGKYVLIKFTATWCAPCKMQIPGMLDAYKKYKNKGLEIVSVYMWERDADPVAAVKKYVAGEKLPWLILSESLLENAQHPQYGDFYAISGVPTIVLVDKQGKIIMPATHGEEWKAKLEEIFK